MSMNMNLTEERICPHCGCIIEGEGRLVYGTYSAQFLVCEDCYAGRYTICEDCGKAHRTFTCCTVKRADGSKKQVCGHCARANYTYCCDCNYWYERHDIWASDNNGRNVCVNCKDAWTVCEDCDALIYRDSVRTVRGHAYCSYCAVNHHTGVIHNYSYKPEPEFQYRSSDNENTALTFGVEKEVDFGDDRLTLADDLCDLHLPMYLKNDGSLEDEGLEIVTHPCSLAYHMYEFRWAEVDRICRNNGYEDGAYTTGLHIHVGRKQMGKTNAERDIAAGNLVLLVNRLWDKLVTFSRRDEDRLEEWAQCPCVSVYHKDDEELTEEALCSRDDGRYQAVNLQNRNTVEIRIFKGTLKRETTIAAIQLVSNLTKYAMTHTPTECTTAEWSDVVSIEKFKELDNYCRKMGL